MNHPARIASGVWLVVALALVAYTNSGAKDAIIVGTLYLTLWTFPIGVICFIWQAYGLPWYSTPTTFLFEQILIVAVTFVFWFHLVPRFRSWLRTHFGRKTSG